MSSLLERRQSYDRIPRFFFPKPERSTQATRSSASICQARVAERITRALLRPAELQRVISAITARAYAPKLSTFQRRMVQKTVPRSSITVINHLLDDLMVIELSYDDFTQIAQCVDTREVLQQELLAPDVFLMLPADDHGRISGYTLLEYILQTQRLMAATAFLCQQTTLSLEGTFTEVDLTTLISCMIQNGASRLALDAEFYPYYERICTRMLLLRHDLKASRGVVAADALLACPLFLEFFQLMDVDLHDHFVVASNRFDVETVRCIHRQYLQLDRDKNGLLSREELVEYGKKKAFNPTDQTPTHDLTHVFVDHVMSEVAPQGEMDYRAYIDLTLTIADTTSLPALRFYWNVLDVQKQGFLDAFTLDLFLRGLVDKIREHNDDDENVTVERIRTQVFDLVAPRDPLRITWKDLAQCRLGHLVVRLLTDYVAYRAYEACDGRFPLPESV